MLAKRRRAEWLLTRMRARGQLWAGQSTRTVPSGSAGSGWPAVSSSSTVTSPGASRVVGLLRRDTTAARAEALRYVEMARTELRTALRGPSPRSPTPGAGGSGSATAG